MIRIDISRAALMETIHQARPTWAKRAKTRLDKALAAGRVEERDGIWGEIKEVFILLQGFKCIYCESPMPQAEPDSANKVAVAYDVEHFRPKYRVKPWPTPKVLAARPHVGEYQAALRPGAADGYLRLAFDPLNYLIACKVCNTSYKADHFPIAGEPDLQSTERVSLDANERPLLLFPFGEDGDEPEKFLRFDGPLVRLVPVDSHGHLRARVVVDFFELDTREDLLFLRCWLIQLLWVRLERRTSPDPRERARAEDFLRVVEKEVRFPQTACGRAFIKLYERDREHARLCNDIADDYLTRKDSQIFKILEEAP